MYTQRMQPPNSHAQLSVLIVPTMLMSYGKQWRPRYCKQPDVLKVKQPDSSHAGPLFNVLSWRS